MTGAASAVAVGHILLNFFYLLSGLLYETVSIATGLSVTFSVALALSIFVYAIKQLRWAMVVPTLSIKQIDLNCLIRRIF